MSNLVVVVTIFMIWTDIAKNLVTFTILVQTNPNCF